MSTVEALIPGTMIGSFEVKETLGLSNHGVAYRAQDTERGRDVSIQEYLPVAFAKRTRDGVSVEAIEEKKTAYENGLTLFLQEARILAQIHDPYIARTIEYTETNGTAYLVIEHEAGQTLHSYLQNHPKLTEEMLQNILIPMLKGLRVIHSQGLLHRDIRPSSIFLREDGPPVLIGFGSVVRTVVDKHVSLDTRVTPGYSPIEQYHDGGNLGPWTDLYALGATMYRCIAGVTPVDATKRVAAIAQGDEDPLVPAMEIGIGDYSTHLLGNIDWMLRPVITERPESAGAVLGLLSRDHRRTHSATMKPTPGQQSLSLPSENDSNSAYHLPYQSLRQGDKSARSIPQLRKRVRKPNGWVVAGMVLAGLIGFALWQTNRDLDRPSDDGTVAKGVDQATPPHEYRTSTITPARDEPVNIGREDDDLRAEAFRELEKDQQQIEKLLASARVHVEAGKLVSPPQNNALTDFRAVLDIDPEQVDAKQGINDIITAHVDKARESFEKEDIKQAEMQLDEVEHFQSGREDASELRQQIQKYKQRIEQEKQLAELQRKREAAARNRRVENLLTQAETAMQEDRLTTPTDNSALSHYRRVLQLDEQNVTALAGIKEIGRRYLSKAGQAIVDGDLESGQKHLNAAITVQADSDTISLLRAQLQARRTALEQEAQHLEREAQEVTRRELAQQIQQQRQRAILDSGIKAYYRGAYNEAFRILNPLADAGYPRAQFRLGMMYNLGRGVTRNAELAQQLIRKALPTVQSAATSGEAWAQADLGSLYEDGLVVAKNDVEAVRWYRLAAQQGYAGAQTNLGVMYANGTGVEQDIDEAIRWLQRAAAQGDKIAAENLATLGTR
jgi:serine/threonine protein kinase